MPVARDMCLGHFTGFADLFLVSLRLGLKIHDPHFGDNPPSLIHIQLLYIYIYKHTVMTSAWNILCLYIYIYIYIIPGWWCTYPSEKYEFVNGKDYPIYEMENEIHV